METFKVINKAKCDSKLDDDPKSHYAKSDTPNGKNKSAHFRNGIVEFLVCRFFLQIYGINKQINEQKKLIYTQWEKKIGHQNYIYVAHADDGSMITLMPKRNAADEEKKTGVIKRIIPFTKQFYLIEIDPQARNQ